MPLTGASKVRQPRLESPPKRTRPELTVHAGRAASDAPQLAGVPTDSRRTGRESGVAMTIRPEPSRAMPEGGPGLAADAGPQSPLPIPCASTLPAIVAMTPAASTSRTQLSKLSATQRSPAPSTARAAGKPRCASAAGMPSSAASGFPATRSIPYDCAHELGSRIRAKAGAGPDRFPVHWLIARSAPGRTPLPAQDSRVTGLPSEHRAIHAANRAGSNADGPGPGR